MVTFWKSCFIAMKRHNDGDCMPYHGCLLVAVFVKIVSCLENIICSSHTYTDKTSNEVCISSWFQLFMHNLEISSLALSKWKPFF